YGSRRNMVLLSRTADADYTLYVVPTEIKKNGSFKGSIEIKNRDGEVIAKAHNKKVKKNCAVFHAEIECLIKATKKLDNWNLKGCELYVTLEPCMMCMGAIVNSRIDKVYFGCKDPKGGALVSNIRFKRIKNLNHYPEYKGGIMEKECSQILKDFFKNKR
ncbi:MAG: nucleoside deaminase, partial [Erysipelotrichaceae bacterium]|nr:nucleoside deaminase [Erysipelotrichaceae bacterium]